jgi:hypothetical protein
MDLQIQITGSDETAEYTDLVSWLNGNRTFRGCVRTIRRPAADGDLGGGMVELITVALGSGGIGVALTTSLNKWLESRRPGTTATVTMTPEGRTVTATFEARKANEKSLAQLREFLRNVDET